MTPQLCQSTGREAQSLFMRVKALVNGVARQGPCDEGAHGGRPSCFAPKGMAAAKQKVGHDHGACSRGCDLNTSVKGGFAGILGFEISMSSPLTLCTYSCLPEAEAQIPGHEGKSWSLRGRSAPSFCDRMAALARPCPLFGTYDSENQTLNS